MKPHPRIRKTVKWGGAAVTVLLVVVWIGSGWFMLHWGSSSGTLSEFHVWRGSVHIVCDTGRPTGGYGPPPGWWMGRTTGPFEISWDFSNGVFPSYPILSPAAQYEFQLALWPLPATAFILASGVWWLDGRARRRAMLHLCTKCRYDRTGLPPQAPCPECGAAPTVSQS